MYSCLSDIIQRERERERERGEREREREREERLSLWRTFFVATKEEARDRSGGEMKGESRDMFLDFTLSVSFYSSTAMIY